MRHEHHSHDWYRDRGWHYDYNYWRTHRAHRYCNDSLGIYIIDTTGPGYGYSSYGDYYAYDYETRLAVQMLLKELGYYHGALDGIIGPATQAAIGDYQWDYSLPVTERIDTSLLQSLQLL